MFEVKITASPELVQAINNLAAALSGMRFQTANPTPAPATPAPTQPTAVAPAAPAASVQPVPPAPVAPTTGPAAAPANIPGQTYPAPTAPAANPTQVAGSAPTAPTGAPVAPTAGPTSAFPSNPVQVPGVPVAPPPPEQYTVDQIMAAGATLMDAGRVDDLVNLLRTFGVAAVTDLKPEQMGAFATALRSLGARI